MGVARSRCFSGAILVVLLSAVGGGSALAQGAGEVDGHIQDAEGKALPGVTVKLLKAGQEANQQQTSDAQGNFQFERLASGVYIATAALEGFGSVTCPGVRIVASLSRHLEIKMMPAEGEQSSSTCQIAAGN
jgi:hypothetical protein